MGRYFRNRLLIAVAFFLMIAGLPVARPVHAATVTVNSLIGLALGGCNAVITICTLPDAVNAAASGDTISFSVSGTILLSSSIPPITKSLTIDGTGTGITIDGQSNVGVGSIFNLNTNGVTFNLINLTIQHGSAGSATYSSGGAIFIGANATVNITNCTFANNQAINPSLGGGAIEIYNKSATVNINTSTFSNNSTSNSTAGSYISGGAIDNEGGGIVNIANSTFTGNTASGAYFAAGGAIFTWAGGIVNIANSTFFNNNANAQGAGGAINANPTNGSVVITNSSFLRNYTGGVPVDGIVNFTNAFLLQNSIVSQGGCLTPVVTVNDLVDDTSCGGRLGSVTNLASSLASNGGLTQTLQLLAGSNAIDAVPAGQCNYPPGFPNLPLFNGGNAQPINVDQRGTARAQGPACDIGAYEVQPGTPTSLTLGGFPSPTTAGANNTFQVTAHDAGGYTAYSYRGTVQFTSSDVNGSTVLPGNYTFQTGDYGSHRFNAQLTKAGTQSIKAADILSGALVATQNGIVVGPASASKIVFTQQPTDALINVFVTPPIVLAEEDTYNNVETSDGTTQLSMAISSNPGSSNLNGTTTLAVVSGVASFSSLSFDKPGIGYKLLGYSANAPLIASISNAFNISTPPPTATPTSTPTSTPTATPIPAKIDSIGIFRTGTFYLRLHNSTGNADLTVAFTAGTKPYPIVGDWTGSGFDTVGVYDQSNGQFTLCTANVTASCANVANQKTLVLGVPNDQPLSGRWLVSATNAGVGVFRPSNGLIYLKNALSTGFADDTMVLGIPGDTGLAGDWNGKGFDSPGVYRPSNSHFYLSNQVTNGSVIGDYQFQYGVGGDAPVSGDWIGQGHDGVGLFRQSNGFTYLKNQLVTGYADNSFTYGVAGDVPVAGHWQAIYPPSAPPVVLVPKTVTPSAQSGSIGGDNQIGD